MKIIETAPRDGRIIMVSHPEVGEFAMRWNPVGYNDTFAPYAIGIWEAPDGSFTWKDGGVDGPSHWRDLVVGCT